MGTLLNDDEIWNKKLESVINFMDTYNKRPAKSSNDKTENRLGSWICKQDLYFKDKLYTIKYAERYSKFNEFKAKYDEYFKVKTLDWDETLKLVDEFITKHNRRPCKDKKKP